MYELSVEVYIFIKHVAMKQTFVSPTDELNIAYGSKIQVNLVNGSWSRHYSYFYWFLCYH